MAKYYSVVCEAPGSLGPSAVYRYDPTNSFIEEVDYLDLEFEVWLGGELVTNIGSYCVSAALWAFLCEQGISGVSVREMTVTPRLAISERAIPKFKELVLVRTARGSNIHYPIPPDGPYPDADRFASGCILEAASIPGADMFAGGHLPLIITERCHQVLCSYPRTGASFYEIGVA